jgi:ribulose-phosphate 3-epimerase
VVKIAPSILSADFSKFPEQVKAAVNGGADYIHVDVMDGHFVPNITFGPIIVQGVRKLTDLTVDVHLMIENPDDYLALFAEAGADILTVHYETCSHLWRTIDRIHELGIKAGITLNPATPVELLNPVLAKIEMVLVMTVEPGFGGQKFIDETLKKIEYLNIYKQRNNLNFDIEVDGGIGPATAPKVVKAGANILVAGNSIFGSDNISQAIKDIKNAASVGI